MGQLANTVQHVETAILSVSLGFKAKPLKQLAEVTDITLPGRRSSLLYSAPH